MRLSAPIYHLKRKAKALSRQQNIPLHQALDQIASSEGFRSWSLLAAKSPATASVEELFERLGHGDLLLVAARPGQGKTLMGLRLSLEAMKHGHRSVFFSLEYTERDVLDRFRKIGLDGAQFGGLFEFDNSDAISSDYIIGKLSAAPRGTLAVIDYLQILDQKREKPELMLQISALKSFAKERGLIMVFISQIDRSYDPSTKPCPDLEDVRLPNPLDLTLFDKTLFLNGGEVRFHASN
jgi:replicative DNA helicase